MKFLRAFLFCCFTSFALMASDPITIDSLFKKQVGLRSVTSLAFLSSGNPYIYTTYPDLVVQQDGREWSDVKQLSLSQTFIYTLFSQFDLLVAGNGSYTKQEYFNYNTLGYESENSFHFDSLWIGGIYSAPSIGGFIPQITLQGGIVERERRLEQTKNFTFKSLSAQFALRNYSDPMVSSVYIRGVYNAKRRFDLGELNYGNTLAVGLDLSIVLSPKISLDAGLEQRFQGASKFNGAKISNSYSIPTFLLGVTYSLNADTSFSIAGSAGGSSSAPDSIFTLSLWRRF